MTIITAHSILTGHVCIRQGVDLRSCNEGVNQQVFFVPKPAVLSTDKPFDIGRQIAVRCPAACRSVFQPIAVRIVTWVTFKIVR